MKLLRIIAALVLTPVGLSFAADTPKNATKKEKGPPEWDALFGNVPLPLVWQSAMAASEKISAALAEKKTDGIPDWAETIHLASHALSAQAKATDADKQANLTDAFRLSARIADEVTAGAWANDVAKTNTSYQHVKTALSITQRNLPKEIVDAPPQTPRFAQKVKREPAAK